MSVRRPRVPTETTQSIQAAEETTVEQRAAIRDGDVISSKILDGLQPFDESRTANEIVQLRQQHAMIVVQIGRRLEQARVHFLSAGGRGNEGGFGAFCKGCAITSRTAYNYIAVPAGTPREIVLAVNAAFNRALADPDIAARMAATGLAPIADHTPEQAADTILQERARWKQVIDRAGIRLEG